MKIRTRECGRIEEFKVARNLDSKYDGSCVVLLDTGDYFSSKSMRDTW